MDAGTRWMLRRGFSAVAVGFAALAAGCSLTSSVTGPISRLQAPDDTPGDAPDDKPAAPPPTTPATVSPPGEPTIQPAVEKLAADATPQVRVVAVIGSDVFITDDEVWQLVRQRLIGLYSNPGFTPPDAAGQKALEKKFFDEELKHLVEREVVLADWLGKIKKAKPQALEELKGEANGMAKKTFADFRKSSKSQTEEEFVKNLALGGLSYKLLMRQLERNAMLTIYMQSYLKDKGKTIGTGEVERYYQDHPEEFRAEERLKWMDLFVSYRRFNTEAEARAFAEWLLKQVKDPAADFAAVVKKHGHGTSPLAGGVGVGAKFADVRPAELVPALKALKAGEVSGLVPVEGGLHILKLAEYTPAEMPPFDEKVQTYIRRKLTAQIHEREQSKLVEELQRRTTVKVYPAVP